MLILVLVLFTVKFKFDDIILVVSAIFILLVVAVRRVSSVWMLVSASFPNSQQRVWFAIVTASSKFSTDNPKSNPNNMRLFLVSS